MRALNIDRWEHLHNRGFNTPKQPGESTASNNVWLVSLKRETLGDAT